MRLLDYGVKTRGANVSAYPAWRPAEGTFADIGTSTLATAKPTGWPTGDNGGPFANWSGGVWAPWWGDQGGYIIHGSGHLSAGAPLWAGVWVWDVANATWVGRCVPSQPLVEGSGTPPSGFNDYLESTVTETLGHTYAPHTYDGLVALPPTEGYPQGRLARVCMPGSGVTGSRSVHTFDLSSATATPERVMSTMNGITNSYPQTAYDAARNGIWTLSYNGAGGVGFIDVATWTETHWSTINYGTYANNNMIHVPASEPNGDYLVCIGSYGTGGSQMGVVVSKIVDNAPTAFVRPTQSGTPPGDYRCGGVWCTDLGCIVSYTAAGSYTVHKLTPPAGDPTAGTWTWTSETLTGADGAVPAEPASAPDNGAWSRFVYAREIGCFLWADSIAKVTQAWRLTGT